MDKYVILHNPHDKKSRDFVTANPEMQVIEFYTTPTNEFVEYCSKNLPLPSIFPCVVDTEAKVKIDNVQSFEEALEKIAELQDRTTRAKIFDAKNLRNELFASTSWLRERHADEIALQLPTTLSEEQWSSWLEYWQKLRDMDFSEPDNIVFPKQP